MLFYNDEVTLEMAHQKVRESVRLAEQDRLLAQLCPSWQARLMNRVGVALVALGNELQRRYRHTTNDSILLRHTDIVQG